MRCSIFNAALDTGNLGVSALGLSLVHGLGSRIPGVQLTVFDYSRGLRHGVCEEITFEQLGASPTRRWYRPESHARIETSIRAGLPCGPSATRLAQTDAFIDISGGDSFTDLYGPHRLKSVAWPKLLALKLGKPLILPPQTYGPFASPEAKSLATRLVRGSATAWARDERSFAALQDLLGDAFDPTRHRCGVDVAFLLPTTEPDRTGLPEPLPAWIDQPDPALPLAGINVSGLIYNDPEAAKTRFGFIADYHELMQRLVAEVLDRGARVVLVPHVVTPPGHYESDIDAAKAIVETLTPAQQERVTGAPAYDDPRQIKGLIGHCDWFCGTRMHATIAGLSQGVPTAAVAYSIKTVGVFETCGQGDHVVDPRQTQTDELLHALLRSFETRTQARALLAEHLPKVLGQAASQMDAIAETIMQAAEKTPHTAGG